jgi:hypothetical protein
MPSTSEKQKRFFGAVMGAKKGQKGVSGAAKKVAKDMPKKEIKKYLKVKESMSFAEFFYFTEGKTKQRLDPKCWKGYRKVGTKKKGNKIVNDCRPIKK